MKLIEAYSKTENNEINTKLWHHGSIKYQQIAAKTECVFISIKVGISESLTWLTFNFDIITFTMQYFFGVLIVIYEQPKKIIHLSMTLINETSRGFKL